MAQDDAGDEDIRKIKTTIINPHRQIKIKSNLVIMNKHQVITTQKMMRRLMKKVEVN